MKTLRNKKQSEEQYQSAVQKAFWASISRLDYNAARDLVTKIHDGDARLNAYRRLQLMCVNLGRIDWALEVTPFAARSLTEGDYFSCARASARGEIESFVECVEWLDCNSTWALNDRELQIKEWAQDSLDSSFWWLKKSYDGEVLLAMQYLARYDTTLGKSYWLKRLVFTIAGGASDLPLDLRIVRLAPRNEDNWLHNLTA